MIEFKRIPFNLVLKGKYARQSGPHALIVTKETLVDDSMIVYYCVYCSTHYPKRILGVPYTIEYEICASCVKSYPTKEKKDNEKKK